MWQSIMRQDKLGKNAADASNKGISGIKMSEETRKQHDERLKKAK